MQEIKRILVPLDFSDVSRAALSMGLQLAESHDAKLYVLHVVKDLAKELQKRLVSAPNDTVVEERIPHQTFKKRFQPAGIGVFITV